MMKKAKSPWATVGLVIAALVAWGTVALWAGDRSGKDANRLTEGNAAAEKSNQAYAKTNSAITAVPQAEYPPHTSGWRYTVEKDEMRGTTRKVAYLDSPQRLEFQFPYAGATTATLYISRRGTAKPVIGLKVDKGQFICSITGETEIQVKFGDRPVEPFGCLVASDGSSNVIFLSHVDLFLARMMKTKTLMIEAQFYREGVRQIRFDTAGLDWK